MPPAIEAQWLSYLRQVIPDSASEVQVRESRRAFYAGAQAFFGLIDEASGDDSVSVDEGAARLEVLNQELQAFARAVSEGRA